MLSQPKIVMNRGSPAAGSARPGMVSVENRSAARSVMHRR